MSTTTDEVPTPAEFHNYLHYPCLQITRVADDVAVALLADPAEFARLSGGTYCIPCDGTFPLDQFVWVRWDGERGHYVSTERKVG